MPEQQPIEIIPVDPETKLPQPTKKGGSVFIGTLNIVAQPAKKLLVHPLKRRYHRHYHPRHRFGHLHLVADIALVTTVVTLIALIAAFNNGAWFAPQDPFAIAVRRTPEEIVIGAPVTYAADITYRGEKTMKDVRVALNVPRSIEIVGALPDNQWDSSSSTWTMGDLTKEARQRIEFTVRLWAPQHKREMLTLVATGGEAGGNLVRQQWTQEMSAGSTALEARPTMPATTILKQPVSLTWTVRNTSRLAIANASVAITNPTGWKLSSSLPQPTEGRWNLPSLGAGEISTITLNGSFAELTSSPSFTLELFHERASSAALMSFRADTTLLDPALDVSAKIVSPTRAIQPGEKVTVEVSAHNRGDFTINALSITTKVSGPYLDSSSITATNARINPQEGVRWDPTTASALASVVPDQRLSFPLTFTTTTQTDLARLTPLATLAIVIEPSAQFRVDVQPTTAVQWPGTAASVPINSQLELQAQTRYTTQEGEQIGRGPLPPRVGRETRYWIIVNVSNTIHDVYETVVIMTLPKGVVWTNRTSVTAGDALRFNAQTRTVGWTIGRLDHFLGPNPPQVNASFEVTVRPTANDVGKELVLLESARVRGVDVVTKNELTDDLGPVDTRLPGEPRGKGVVGL